MAYIPTATHGGDGGDAFSDDLTEVLQLVGVNIRSDRYVDAIQCVWQTTVGRRTGPMHGGDGGDAQSFELASGEYIVRVDGRSDVYVDQLTFTTNLGHVHGPYGGGGGNPWSIDQLQVGGFLGAAGRYVDQIGFFTVFTG